MISELKTPGAPAGNGRRRQDSPALSERDRSELRAPTSTVLRLCGSIARACALPPKGPAGLHAATNGKAERIKANLSNDSIPLHADLVPRVAKGAGGDRGSY